MGNWNLQKRNRKVLHEFSHGRGGDQCGGVSCTLLFERGAQYKCGGHHQINGAAYAALRQPTHDSSCRTLAASNYIEKRKQRLRIDGVSVQ